MGGSPDQALDYRLLFESAPGLYLVLSPDLKIVGVSEAYLRATMTQREAILGRGLFEVFPDNPEDPGATGASNLRASLDRVIAQRIPDTMAVQKYDVRRPDSEGGGFEERYWSPRNLPVLGRNHELLHILHCVEDVTDFVRLRDRRAEESRHTVELRRKADRMEHEVFQRAQEVQQTNLMLRAANAELEQFAYVASHDLQSPLRSIRAYCQLLAEQDQGALDATAEEHIRSIEAGAEQMQALISGLLAMSVIGRKEAAATLVDFEALLERVLVQLHGLIQERGAEITHEPLPAVPGHELELNQLLQNLIGNAIKFQPGAAPSVHIGARRDGSFWRFSVTDQGIGIEPGHHKEIFNMFQRLHPAIRFAGSGIGLAICEKVVRHHRGRIWVESAPGRGSTFHFALPAAGDTGLRPTTATDTSA
ncbi:MAG TPA: ATP-binding protein [Solimonas sp.]|nr:ATP-binding protein [Solimonas sp.]